MEPQLSDKTVRTYVRKNVSSQAGQQQSPGSGSLGLAAMTASFTLPIWVGCRMHAKTFR
jgi:hypothetical protein